MAKCKISFTKNLIPYERCNREQREIIGNEVIIKKASHSADDVLNSFRENYCQKTFGDKRDVSINR